jgi:hypothetical protein
VSKKDKINEEVNEKEWVVKGNETNKKNSKSVKEMNGR